MVQAARERVKYGKKKTKMKTEETHGTTLQETKTNVFAPKEQNFGSSESSSERRQT